MSGALRRRRKAQARAREAAYAAEKKATKVGGWTTRHGRTQGGEFVKSKTRVTREYRGAAGPVTVITPKK